MDNENQQIPQQGQNSQLPHEPGSVFTPQQVSPDLALKTNNPVSPSVEAQGIPTQPQIIRQDAAPTTNFPAVSPETSTQLVTSSTTAANPTPTHSKRKISAIAIALILVLLILGSLIPWSSKKKVVQTQLAISAKSQTTSPTITKPSAAGSTVNFIPYTQSNVGVNFSYPQTWTVDTYDRDASNPIPSQATYTTSSLSHNQLVATNRSPYKSTLSLTIYVAAGKDVEKYVTPADPLYTKLSSLSTKLGAITMNGNIYQLVGQGQSNQYYAVNVEDCKPDMTCTQQIKRADGSYISFYVQSEGNGHTSSGNTPITMNLSSSDYAAIKQVLGTVKF